MPDQTRDKKISYPLQNDLISDYPALAREAATTIDRELGNATRIYSASLSNSFGSIAAATYAGQLVFLSFSALSSRSTYSLDSIYRPYRSIRVPLVADIVRDDIPQTASITISASGKIDYSRLPGGHTYSGTVVFIRR